MDQGTDQETDDATSAIDSVSLGLDLGELLNLDRSIGWRRGRVPWWRGGDRRGDSGRLIRL